MSTAALARTLACAFALSSCVPACATRAPLPPRPSTTARGSQTQGPSAQALFERGRAYALQGDLSRAQQYVRLAIAAGYPEQRAITALVQVCIAASRLREALEYASAFLRRHPDDWRLRYVVASLDAALGRDRRAADGLRRVIAQRPDAPQPYYLLGVIERDARGNAAAARASFTAYLERDPGGPYAAEVAAWLAEHERGATP